MVRYAPGSGGAGARSLRHEIGADSVEPLGTAVPDGANVLEVRAGAPRLRGELLGETAGDPVRFVLSGEVDPTRRYAVP